MFWYYFCVPQPGDSDTGGGRGYVAHLQPAAGGGQPQSLHNQVNAEDEAWSYTPAHLTGFYTRTAHIAAFWSQKHTDHRLNFPSSLRKVQTESSTGSVGSSRVRTTLTLCVETVDFDSQACQLRVKGTNIEENQYVKVSSICNVTFIYHDWCLICFSSALYMFKCGYLRVCILFGTQFPFAITNLQTTTKCECIVRFETVCRNVLVHIHSKQRSNVTSLLTHLKIFYAFADCVLHWNSFATVINWCSPILSVSGIIFNLYSHLMLSVLDLLVFPRQMGAYHTIELELNRKFTLAKKSWDSILLDRIGKQLLLFVFDWDFSEFYLVTATT